MRKIVAAVALVAMSATAAVAQGGGGGGGGGQRAGGGMNSQQMKDMYFAGITLSAEQSVKIDSIIAKYTKANADLRADASLEGPARREKMMENRSKQNDEFKAVLTDDQKKVFEKTLADMAARMQGGGGRPPQN
jgi:Spy/CpxP family protein refolding chaperone